MKKKQRKTKRKKPNNQNNRDYKDIYSLGLLGASILIIVFVFTKATGVIGSYVKIILAFGVGVGSYVLAFFLLAMAAYYMLSKAKQYKRFAVGLLLIFLSFLALIHVSLKLDYMFKPTALRANGGVIGSLFAYSFKFLLGINASYIIFMFIFAIGLLLLTNRTLPEIWQLIVKGTGVVKEKINDKQPSEKLTQKVEKLKSIELTSRLKVEPEIDFANKEEQIETNKTIELKEPSKGSEYQLPPLSMFSRSKTNKNFDKKSVRQSIKVLEKTLSDFDVNAVVNKVVKGPTVTRYEIQLASGVKVNRILTLSDDISLAFGTPDVRILAPIPGKSAIGIEVPNTHRELVTIGDILNSKEMAEVKSLLSIAIGSDISAHAAVGDLAQMPHLLIAGATGSGKSVCLNSIIATLISRATPSELKLILIDPKRVELNLFNGIPHLLTPVVINPKQASHALNWVVEEMEKRYETLAEKNVKNIASYNAEVAKGCEENMPFIVVVIDELADLMMVAARDVEDAICRLAQLARAVGIHLVIASQRPSTDVITGLIKANITNRIAFAVSSQIDSRVILDTPGAEKLTGKGDMLFSTPQYMKPKRIQAAFISEKEITNLCNFIKSQRAPSYVHDITTQKKTEFSLDDFKDELYDKAIELVVASKKASVSYLQRRLRIGYGRAARLMDMLEDNGVVGPQEGSKPREVLITKEELGQLAIDG